MSNEEERTKGKPKTKTKSLIELANERLLETGEITSESGERKKLALFGGLLNCFLNEKFKTKEAIASEPLVISSEINFTSQITGGNEIMAAADTTHICIDLVDQTSSQIVTRANDMSSGQPEAVSIEPTVGVAKSDTSIRSLDEVRSNFYTLISFNKLQSFLVAALIYSTVILASIIGQYILSPTLGSSQFNISNHNISDNDIRNVMTLVNRSSNNLSTPIVSTHFGDNRNNHSTGEEGDTMDLTRGGAIKNSYWLKISDKLMLLLLYLLLEVILICSLISLTVEFSSEQELESQQSSTKNSNKRGKPQRFALLATLSAFFLQPTASLLLFILRNKQEVSGYLNLVPNLALIYLLPALLYSPNRQWTCLKPLVFIVALSLAAGQLFLLRHRAPTQTAHWILLPAACISAALLFGLQLEATIRRAVTGSTFDGATQLVEAKVSLEHQRQQQETLLLSVLPAYVAEHFKRNMLKKTTSPNLAAAASTSGGGEPPTDYLSAAAQPQATTVQWLAGAGQQKSRSFTTLQTTTTTSNPIPRGDEPKPPSERLAASGSSSNLAAKQQQSNHLLVSQPQQPQQQQRHSFLVHTRALTSGLAASAALISETFSSHSSARSGARDSSAVASENNNQMTPPQLSLNPIPSSSARRGFNELYIRTYNNVSLLYGDIVGFTRLCTQLSSWQLVRVLNDLFSHFDHLAETHRIMRIKILGDCYYGVGGIPEFAVMGSKSRNASRNENHAINCVNMGLDMIHYIRRLNVERATSFATHLNHSAQPEEAPATGTCTAGGGSPMPSFELNMRIGIHTGHIHSGVIGLKKWQFDVWSNDVSIAMHCESSGVAGRVQVTQATAQQLNGAFTYEDGHGPKRDLFLASKDIGTYLIKGRSKPSTSSTSFAASSEGAARHASRSIRLPVGGSGAPTSAGRLQKAISIQQPTCPLSPQERTPKLTITGSVEAAPSRDQAASAEASNQVNSSSNNNKATTDTEEDHIRAATIGTIRQTLLAGETCNASPSNSYGLALSHHDMRPLSLTYRDQCIGKLCEQRPTSLMVQARELGSLLLLGTAAGLVLSASQSQAKLATSRRLLTTILLVSTAIGLAYTLVRRLCCGHCHFRPPVLPVDPLATLGPEQVIRHKQGKTGSDNSGRPNLKLLSVALQKLSYLNAMRRELIDSTMAQWAAEPWDSARGSGTGSAVTATTSRLRTLTTVAAAGLVLLAQAYAVVMKQQQNQRCGLPDAGVNRWPQQPTEQYQLILLLLIVLLNASSSLLTYRVKLLLYPLMVLLHSFQMLTGNRCDKLPAPEVSNSLIGDALLLGLILLSYSISRQLEYTERANFLWRNRLNVDHEELEYISGINKVLLENILPSHVVQHYLTHPPANHSAAGQRPGAGSGRPGTKGSAHQSVLVPQLSNYMRMSFSKVANLNEGLYHEQHESVSVMFASIPHFYEFYDESDISKQGLGCIALLNEIICDFDKLLLKNKFSRIEKIKTIGSTYMAAAGLRPSSLSGARNSTASQVSVGSSSTVQQPGQWSACASPSPATSTGAHFSSFNVQAQSPSKQLNHNLLTAEPNDRRLVMSQQKLNLICMVFKLRIGVNTGPVIAGVIGAQRPFYDIWGDCVNIASRMESLGEVGRIQVEEKTAKLLMESLCPETYSIVRRGPIDVKGKGGMVTYFVDRKLGSLDISGAAQRD